MATIKVKGQIYVFVIGFCVILGPENVYLDYLSKWFRNWDIETCIFWRPFLKMAAIKVKGQIWNGPMAKIYRHSSASMQNVMLLSFNAVWKI